MNSDSFIELIASRDVKEIYQEIILDEEVFIFKDIANSSKKYHNLKVQISKILNINPKNIAIVGSAKLGFSLSPDKNFREFIPYQEGIKCSDIDLIIVSEFYYKSLWKSALDYAYSFSASSYNSRAKEIFKHFISINQSRLQHGEIEYFKDWVGKIEKIKRIFNIEFNILNDINYRVYENWEFADTYHINGMEKLKNAEL